MPNIKTLIENVQDPNDYDGVLMVMVKNNQIANIGFTGAMQQGIDQKVFLYRLLTEAGFAIAFTDKQPEKKEASSVIKH
jgi:hypothetical protein